MREILGLEGAKCGINLSFRSLDHAGHQCHFYVVVAEGSAVWTTVRACAQSVMIVENSVSLRMIASALSRDIIADNSLEPAFAVQNVGRR